MRNKFFKFFFSFVVLLISIFYFHTNPAYGKAPCDGLDPMRIKINVTGKGSWEKTGSSSSGKVPGNFDVPVSLNEALVFTVETYAEPSSQNTITYSYSLNDPREGPNGGRDLSTYVTSPINSGGGEIKVWMEQFCTESENVPTRPQLEVTLNLVPPTDSCTIGPFTADQYTIPQGTGTTLRYSLSTVGNPSPINISLLAGSVLPNPSSLTKTSTSSTTGALTATHMYRLTCGADTKDVTVTVLPPKYRCYGDGSCKRDDTTGDTTDPTCNNSCGNLPVNGGWSAWSPLSCPSACGQPASDKTRNCDNPTPENGGDQCLKSDGVSRGLTETVSCAATAPCVGPVAGACSSPAVHYTCSAGTPANQSQDITHYAWSCLGINGGADTSCSESKSNVTGTLTASPASCQIPFGDSSCNTTLTWTTTNPVVGVTSAVTSSYPVANTTVYHTANSGNGPATVPYGSRDFYLYHNGSLLAQVSASAACVAGTVWNVGQGKCLSTLTVDSVTISSPTVKADDSTQYSIVMKATDSVHGVAYIGNEWVLTNYQNDDSVTLRPTSENRGLLMWDSVYYLPGSESKACSGGGNASIYGAFGTQYVHLDSCSVSDASNTRQVTFTVHFDSSFTSPLIHNDISGWARDVLNNNSGWTNFHTNFSLWNGTNTASCGSSWDSPCSPGSHQDNLYEDANGWTWACVPD